MKEAGILRIGDDVDVYVQHIGGGQVRLCVSAPREIKIQHLPPQAQDRPAAAAERAPVRLPEVQHRRRRS